MNICRRIGRKMSVCRGGVGNEWKVYLSWCASSVCFQAFGILQKIEKRIEKVIITIRARNLAKMAIDISFSIEFF